ncbi:unnamed protein product [Arabis nemorensis]|uniref:Uncharacterized protein n=1 Tax=Arabis nemorensis TaxID=586526 RepID=A0A565CKX5_9BRAS|nr:unnamed protein product [Arabis nemorensis]
MSSIRGTGNSVEDVLKATLEYLQDNPNVSCFSENRATALKTLRTKPMIILEESIMLKANFKSIGLVFGE